MTQQCSKCNHWLWPPKDEMRGVCNWLQYEDRPSWADHLSGRTLAFDGHDCPVFEAKTEKEK